MLFPVDVKYVKEAERKLRIKFPASFVVRMVANNGGVESRPTLVTQARLAATPMIYRIVLDEHLDYLGEGLPWEVRQTVWSDDRLCRTE